MAASFWDTRLQLHWAAQPAAGVGRTLIPLASDASNESFTWSDAHGALVQGLAGGRRAAIRFADLTLLLLDAAGAIVDAMPLNGRTLADGFAFFERHFGTTLARPPEGMPDHAVARGAAFDADPHHLRELATLYANADATLQSIVDDERGAGPVRCWPHHFDIAVSIDVAPGKTIGAGLSPGDDSMRAPYWYVTPFPYPPAASLPPLTAGTWHTEGWTGALLPAAEDNDRAFLRDAIAICRSLLA